MRVRLATCRVLPEPDADAEPLTRALEAAGVTPVWSAWDDPDVDWDEPVPTVLRSTWNYPLALAGFHAWLERASRAAPLFNPAEVVRENTHKGYLLELAARGVRTVPTQLVARGTPPRLAERARDAGWAELIVKPAVGAGSLGVGRFMADDPAAERHAAGLAAAGDVLVQPYVPSVEAYGERSLVWIDGAPSHAIRKAPRLAGDDESVSGPHPIADDELALARAALGPLADTLLYGRVDMVRDGAGQAMVMELELTEPSLFFARGPGSVERFVAGLLRRLA